MRGLEGESGAGGRGERARGTHWRMTGGAIGNGVWSRCVGVGRGCGLDWRSGGVRGENKF